MNRHKLIALMLSCALTCAVSAQEVLLYRAGERPDPQDVARILGRAPTHATGAEPAPDEAGLSTDATRDPDTPRTRGFKLALPASGTEHARPKGNRIVRPDSVKARTEGAEVSALALGVQFAFDSADILPSARAQLDALAEGIKMLAPGQRVTIEGHTDASGSGDYNLSLSERRAISVKQYLIEVHGIGGARLQTIGLGETKPLNSSDPFAVENRRVQFHGG